MTTSDRAAALFRRLEQNPAARAALEEGRMAQRVAGLVRDMREAADLSQSQLSEKLGWSEERVVEIENPTEPTNLTYAAMNEIAKVCGFRMPTTVKELPHWSPRGRPPGMLAGLKSTLKSVLRRLCAK
ncbi:helix-turn-helix transcriptional regulator [Parvularcula dongshanensis]|uniref:Ribosome-binding protein aMBF1 (Putative translation factor) n=1 Tax=Parvularcula dongshanensis TaxID=1173995 RepID=A0A840I698_9PROT|nr:helix-turn-helix transcriptional regulator [Parvularcula dongshanensis]MBB4660409.1 ribosome-binding protein aMBF1 (putative translation factor) [Parvularcula dongshanensis]